MSGCTCSAHRHYTAGCPGCRRVARTLCRRRVHRKATGQFRPDVDAQPVTEHVRALHRSGMTYRHMGRVAELSKSAVLRLAGGHVERVHAYTYDTLMALQPIRTGPAGFVDATGTARRVRALVAIGYGLTAQAAWYGTTRQQVYKLAHQRRTWVADATAARVQAVYDRWSNRPAPRSQPSSRARGDAARSGWVPPIGWDDDTIDDPTARPFDAPAVDEQPDTIAVERRLAGEPLPLTREVDRVEAARRLLAAGRGTSAISRVLHVSGSTAMALVRQVHSEHTGTVEGSAA